MKRATRSEQRPLRRFDQRLLFCTVAALPFSFVPLELVGTYVSTAPFILLASCVLRLRVSVSARIDKFEIASLIFLALTALRMIFLGAVLGDSANFQGGLASLGARLLAGLFLYRVVRETADRDYVVKALLVGAVASGMLAVVQILEGVSRLQGLGYLNPRFNYYTEFGTALRPFGGFLSPTAFAASIAILLLFLTVNRDIFSKRKRQVALGFLSFVLLITQTRAAWLACIAGFLVVALITSQRKVKRSIFDRALVATAAIFFVGVVLLLVAPGEVSVYVNRLATVFNPQFSSNEGRLLLWKETLDSLRGSWLFGNGSVDFAETVSSKLPFGFQQLGHPHNSYLQVAFEGGIFLLIPFVLMFTAALSRMAQNSKSKEYETTNTLAVAAIGALSVFLFNSLVEQLWTSFNFVVLLFVIIGLGSNGKWEPQQSRVDRPGRAFRYTRPSHPRAGNSI